MDYGKYFFPFCGLFWQVTALFFPRVAEKVKFVKIVDKKFIFELISTGSLAIKQDFLAKILAHVDF
jgi:hypothetical protein